MDRTIQYARTADGIQIAYWTLGEGEPLMYMAGGPWNHIEVWDVPQCRSWYERLAENRMLVRYDVRGTGNSQRDVDISLDGYIADLDAVVGELGLDRFSIFAAGDAGPAAISYAVAKPDRLSRLVLWCAYARGADFETSPRIQAWRGLIDQDWDLMADTCAHLAFGWDAGDIGRLAAEGFKASITRETAQIALEMTIASDVTSLLPELRVPTLVLHRDSISWLPKEIALRLASNISSSQLAITRGDTTAPYLGDVEALVNMVDGFLSDGIAPEHPAPPSEKPPRSVPIGSRTPRSPNQRSTGVVEIIPVYLKDSRIQRYAPDGSDSWRVSFDPTMHPGEVAVRALNRLECAPTVVHSTSWRLQDEELVLTYLAVLPGPFASANGFRSIAVEARDVAVGTATGAPEGIDIEEVTAHALRHLVWLIERDGPIGETLDDRWRLALAAYQPEPFSAFDLSGSLSGDDGCLLCTRYSRPLSEFVSKKD